MKENDHRKEKDILQIYLISYSISLMKRRFLMNIERLTDFHFQMKFFDEKSNESNILTMIQVFPTDPFHYYRHCLLDHQ